MTNNKLRETMIFDCINVNSLETQSGVFVGSNTQLNWNTTSKANNGFGTLSGEFNRVEDLMCIVIDPDVIDHPIYPDTAKQQ